MATDYNAIMQDFAAPSSYYRNEDNDMQSRSGQTWDYMHQYGQSQPNSLIVDSDNVGRWNSLATYWGQPNYEAAFQNYAGNYTKTQDEYGSDLYTFENGYTPEELSARFPAFNPADTGMDKFMSTYFPMVAMGLMGAGMAGALPGTTAIGSGLGGVAAGGDVINTAGMFDLAGFDAYNPISLMADTEAVGGAAGTLGAPADVTSLYQNIGNPWSTNSGTMAGDSFNFANSYNGGLPTAGYTTNPLTNFPAGGLAESIAPTSLGGTLGGAAATGGGFWDSIGSALKNFGSTATSGLNSLTQQLPGSPSASSFLPGLLNYFMQSQKQNELKSAAERSAQLNDPLQQPQRLPFQAAYADLMFNPNSYKSTPYAQGQNELARQAFEANVSKFGPGGTQFSDYLKNFQNIQSQDYFKLADQFQTAGGFNQGAGGAGNAFANLAGQAANAGNSAYEGFGRLFNQMNTGGGGSSTSIPSNFDFSSTYKPQENPFGNSTTFSM